MKRVWRSLTVSEPRFCRRGDGVVCAPARGVRPALPALVSVTDGPTSSDSGLTRTLRSPALQGERLEATRTWGHCGPAVPLPS